MEQDQNIVTKQTSVTKNAMNNGAILGIALVLVSLIFYILGVKNSNIAVWVQVILLLTGLALSILYYRKNFNGGFITYGKSLGSGVLTGLFASIIVGFYIYVFFKFMDTAAVEEIIRNSEEAIINKNPDISDEELDMIMSYQRKFMTPLWMGIMTMLTFTFYAFIASLIISIFTRKTDTSFEANFN